MVFDLCVIALFVARVGALVWVAVAARFAELWVHGVYFMVVLGGCAVVLLLLDGHVCASCSLVCVWFGYECELMLSMLIGCVEGVLLRMGFVGFVLYGLVFALLVIMLGCCLFVALCCGLLGWCLLAVCLYLIALCSLLASCVGCGCGFGFLRFTVVL